MSEIWTIKRLLDWTSGFFKEHDSDQPRLDAEVLLAEAIGCQRIELYTRFEEEVGDEVRSKFRGWVKRHSEGEPVAYLVGYREFFSIEFFVNSHVLIPRPETEHLVTETLDLIKSDFATQPQVSIADVGTGSGCISVALAKHCSKAKIQATDISQQALQVAKSNVERHSVVERISLKEGSLLDAVEAPQSLDFVVSNPPYVGQGERDDLPESVKNFEPHSALFSDDDHGRSHSFKLIEQVQDRCRPGCFLLIETSPMNSGALRDKCETMQFDDVRIKKDYSGLERIVVARRSN